MKFNHKYISYTDSHIKLGQNIKFTDKRNCLQGIKGVKKDKFIICKVEGVKHDKFIVKGYKCGFLVFDELLSSKQWLELCYKNGYNCIDVQGRVRRIWWYYSKEEWNLFWEKLFYLIATILTSYFLPYGFIMQFFDIENPHMIPSFIVSLACLYYCMWNSDQKEGALEWLIKGISYLIALPLLLRGCLDRGEIYT